MNAIHWPRLAALVLLVLLGACDSNNGGGQAFCVDPATQQTEPCCLAADGSYVACSLVSNGDGGASDAVVGADGGGAPSDGAPGGDAADAMSGSDQSQAETAGGTGADSGDGGDSLLVAGPDPADIPDDVLAISGKVLDSNTLQPIEGALVTTEPSIGQTTANADGDYVFLGDLGAAIEVGTLYKISATRPGYAPDFAIVTAQPGHNRNVDILLTKAVEELLISAAPTHIQVGASDFTGNQATRTVTLQLDPGATVESQDFATFVPLQHSWISVSPTDGTVGQDPVYLTVTLDRSGLTGVVVGTFDVVGPGGHLTIDVTMNL